VNVRHCLHCPRVALYRGVCDRCYDRMRKLRRAGRSWGQLEREGLVLPAVGGAARAWCRDWMGPKKR
jgi:hypothetical protein